MTGSCMVLWVINCLAVDQTNMMVLASNLCTVLLDVKQRNVIPSSKFYGCSERQMNSSLLDTLNEMLLPHKHIMRLIPS